MSGNARRYAAELPTLQDVYLARRRIAGHALRTPLLFSPGLSRAAGVRVWLKPEGLQEPGSFKVRGAVNRILGLTAEERERGVVTFSTGNHGRAVAWAASRLGVPAVVCLSERVPAYRVEAIRALGAEAVVGGRSQDEAEERCRRLREERGLAPVEPFDDPLVIAGQGTIGLELAEDLPEIGAVLAPLSGGGLLSGIALALKSLSRSIRVVGVSAATSPVMQRSVAAGRPVRLEEQDSLADSLLGGIGRENRYTLAMVGSLADELVEVGEEPIGEAMAWLLREHRLVAEGAAAVPVAALLQRLVGKLPEDVALVISGGSVELPRYLAAVRRYLEG